MDQTYLLEFGAVLIVAAVLGAFARLFKQPLILAYLVSGILIGPFALGVINEPKIIETFASIGIIFLLFLIGLELNPKKLLEIGNTALIAGFFQILFSGIFYFIAVKIIGYSSTASAYMAVALAFSSTAIIITLLSNKNDLDTLHGKLLVGILLVQDFVAIFLLTIMSGINSSGDNPAILQLSTQIIFRAIILFISIFLISKYVFPPIFRRIARSHELLFITPLAWCFFLSIVALSLGFSAEIGAFLAGVSLATLPYSHHIASKTRPLRDFFIMIFFIFLGTNLVFKNIETIIIPAIAISLLVLIINPIVVTLVLSFMGYRRRTVFLTGISLTQISEFAFIVVALGIKSNILPKEALTLVSMVAVITVFVSTYLYSASNKIYSRISPLLNKIKEIHKAKDIYNLKDEIKDHIVLIGYHRMGTILFEALKAKGETVAVIDYDPKRIQELIDRNEICTYADAVDHDIIEELNLKKAKMVISTIEKIEENQLVMETYRVVNKKLKVILTAQNIEEAEELYQLGADLVVVPSLISGDYLAYLLGRINKKEITIEQLKSKELESIANGESDQLVRQFAAKTTSK